MIRTYKLSLFYTGLGIFVMSILLLILSNRLLLVFIGWEGLGVTSFILIIFYQNWMRTKGGLLTLLTNRIGDAIILLMFCWWLTTSTEGISKMGRGILALTLRILALTKSAQWPFISWLPAAMAAPTPVRALVHRSTLVTAGVWLLIRFGLMITVNTFLWVLLGMLTLTVASLSALLETDAKKIVALSTLRQLGLMLIRLIAGTTAICVFHILMHAFAKANLFLIVGRLLFSRFAQQDTRFIRTTLLRKILILGLTISLLRLTGISFLSGFYSKEQILLGQYSLLRSVFSWGLVFSLARLTAAYCFKLLSLIRTNNSQRYVRQRELRVSCFSSVFLLSRVTLLSGWFTHLNFTLPTVVIHTLQGIYWRLGIFGFLGLAVRAFHLNLCNGGFYTQLKILDISLRKWERLKSLAKRIEVTRGESFILFSSQTLRVFIKLNSRVILLGSVLFISAFLF